MTEQKKKSNLEAFLNAHGQASDIQRLFHVTDPSQGYAKNVYEKAEKSLRDLAYSVAKTTEGFDSARYKASDLSSEDIQTYANQLLVPAVIDAANQLENGGLEGIVDELAASNKLDRAEKMGEFAEPYQMALAKEAETHAKKAYDGALAKTKDKRIAELFRSSVIVTYKSKHMKGSAIAPIVKDVLKNVLKDDPNKALALLAALAKK